MRMIFTALALIFATSAMAQVAPESDKPPSDSFNAAKQWGYSPVEVYKLNRKLKSKVDVDAIQYNLGSALEHDKMLLASYMDEAVENLLRRADGVLRATGNMALADEIATDYQLTFRGGVTYQAMGPKEIGDHPPISEWLGKIHAKIESAIGEFWCKFFHFHDLYILNHSIPVAFAPSKYDLDDYKDHVAGHLMFGFIWEHHGLAGVVTYWLVEGVCSGFTGGLGLVTFACGPIASYAEHVMDKRIAPPIATRVWKRAN